MSETVEVTYDGPAGQHNPEVGAVLAAAAAAAGDAYDGPRGDELEPGRVYQLPQALAERLVSSNSSFAWHGKPPELSGLAAMNAPEAKAHVDGLGTVEELERVRAQENTRETPRVTVLAAIDAREAELELAATDHSDTNEGGQ